MTNTTARDSNLYLEVWAFAKSFFEHAGTVNLLIRDGQHPHYATQGEASYERWVDIRVNYHAYPFPDPFGVPGVPAPTYENFFEEFLYVLAHELEHIDQYGREEWREVSREMLEYKAERKAAQVLLAHRKRHTSPIDMRAVAAQG